MTEGERRQAMVRGVYDHTPKDIEPWLDPVDVCIDGLLAHFDEHEPAVADAIRFGGRTFRNSYGSVMLVIDKPDSEPPPMRMTQQPHTHIIGSDGKPRPVRRRS